MGCGAGGTRHLPGSGSDRSVQPAGEECARSCSYGSVGLPWREAFGFEKEKNQSLVIQKIVLAAGEGEILINYRIAVWLQ